MSHNLSISNKFRHKVTTVRKYSISLYSNTKQKKAPCGTIKAPHKAILILIYVSLYEASCFNFCTLLTIRSTFSENIPRSYFRRCHPPKAPLQALTI